jgi:hypothetical protein
LCFFDRCNTFKGDRYRRPLLGCSTRKLPSHCINSQLCCVYYFPHQFILHTKPIHVEPGFLVLLGIKQASWYQVFAHSTIDVLDTAGVPSSQTSSSFGTRPATLDDTRRKTLAAIDGGTTD